MAETKHAAGILDIRNMIGGLLLAYGVILLLAGLFGDQALDKTGDQVKINCGCNQSYYAYVYPTKPYEIFVCRAFWSAPNTGTDSRAGTLIHEMSHFNVVAGTDDVVYGQTGARSLAISDPNAALNNADSHEYFAENTPSQN